MMLRIAPSLRDSCNPHHINNFPQKGYLMDQVAVLIPCYNEALTIEKVISDTRKYLPEAVIYVYNNNSTDNTAAIAKRAGAIVRNEYMQGKGNVIRRMFREVNARCYLMVDGDDTYPMQSAPQMVERVLKHQADMVVGDRLSSTYFTENKRPFHNFGNSMVRSSINRMFKSNVRDIMTGFRAMSYDFVKSFPVLSKGFEIETEMTIHAVYYNMQIENIIVQYRDRPDGSVSKLNTYKDGFKVIGTILSLYKDYRPMSFFGWISLILFLLSAGFFIPVFNDYLRTGMVLKFPTLIVCCFVMLAAFLAMFAGLILSNMEKQNRRDFEINRIRLNRK